MMSETHCPIVPPKNIFRRPNRSMVKNDAKAANAYTVTLTPPRMRERVLPVPRYSSKMTGQKSARRDQRKSSVFVRRRFLQKRQGAVPTEQTPYVHMTTLHPPNCCAICDEAPQSMRRKCCVGPFVNMFLFFTTPSWCDCSIDCMMRRV